jgi:hypothetical protein
VAHRLQMKLGVVAERDRLPDSADGVIAVVPTVGSVVRSKGQLYLIVTGTNPGSRMREATRLVADTIRSEYYYDESAGIRGGLIKAITAANKRLWHVRDKLGVADTGTGGPIGVGLAVVRGNELYVATVGPAEAYLVRGARLSTLPDPHRERGLPAPNLEPEIWRGEISVGDQLILLSPNVMRRLGPDELKDAMVTLHPQSAIEHLHHRFVAEDGSGSDAMLAVEATEVAVMRSGPTLVPVRPSEPFAGAPDRSPIPLADTVSGGVAAAQGAAEKARAMAGTAFDRLVVRVQDVLPRRNPGARRVTSLSTRRESQRRAATAALAFVSVVGILGVLIFLLGGRPSPDDVISSLTAGQRALEAAQADLNRVSGEGIDLVADDPELALQLLTEAIAQLDAAETSGIPTTTTDPLRATAIAGLDRLYGVVEVSAVSVFTFPEDPVVNLTALVRGPDGAPYVLDDMTKTIFRINLADLTAVAVYRDGTKVGSLVEAAPHLLTVGGPDLLVVDIGNTLWRWKPADATGRGTTNRVNIKGSAEWGDDIRAVGTFVRNADAGLYNFYVVDPSAEQILAYSPSADGSGFPQAPSGRLAHTRPMATVDDLFIDGDIFITDGGGIVRFAGGREEGWTAGAPGDTVLRAAPAYRRLTSGTGRREGLLYAWDAPNGRVIALRKSDGSYVAQYRLTDGATDWSDIRGWFVEPGIDDQPDSLVWITATGLRRALLESAVLGPGESPDLSSESPPASPAASQPSPVP